MDWISKLTPTPKRLAALNTLSNSRVREAARRAGITNLAKHLRDAGATTSLRDPGQWTHSFRARKRANLPAIAKALGTTPGRIRLANPFTTTGYHRLTTTECFEIEMAANATNDPELGNEAFRMNKAKRNPDTRLRRSRPD